MPMTPEDTQPVEDALEEVGSPIQGQIEATAHPTRSFIAAVVAGVVIGKLVL